MITTEQTATIITEPAEAYHARSEISRGDLFDFLESRRGFYGSKIAKTIPRRKTTKAMDFGTLCHGALLEPATLTERYAVIPDSLLSGENRSVSSKEAKAWRDAHIAAGRIVIKEDDLPEIEAVANGVKDECGAWLSSAGHIEKTIIWQHPATGLPCRCKPDWIRFTKNGTAIGFDLKTTNSIDPHSFRGKVESLGYWLQVAHYSEGIELATGRAVDAFIFVAAQNKSPFRARTFELDSESIAAAKEARERLLSDLANCFTTGDWSEPWERTITKLSVRPFAFFTGDI